MTTSSRNITLMAVAIIMAAVALWGCGNDNEPKQQHDVSTKAERNFIREGNKLFADENYADAEVEYSKALQANPSSAIAAYNMGLALAKQAAPGDSTGILQRADSLFSFAASITHDKNLKMMAHYNKGNIAYGYQQYDKAVEDYKNALRAVPTDDDSRYNLRMAQLKLQQQQQQQQQQQDKNQDKNNDQNQQDQNQQDQNKDQQGQQDQNKDQQNQDQQNQNQGQGQDQQAQQDKAKQEQGQQAGKGQQQQGTPINMDERSIQQVLKAMEDKEKQTQQKIYQMGERQREQERRATQNKW